MMRSFSFQTLLIFVIYLGIAISQNIGDTQYVHEWVSIDYDWPADGDREAAIANGSFIIENNVITGIKVYKDEVYVTVSRWLKGVPSTMNKIVNKNGKSIFQPFPSWEMQEIDNCSAFQFTQSMEIDPATGHMWIIDVGRRNIWNSTDATANCPPKLVIYDLENRAFVKSYDFPDYVLSPTQNFVNDIVIDPKSGFAYMSDVGRGSSGHHGGIVVFNNATDTSHRHEHRSMMPEPENINITINGRIYENNVPVDGIALSPDRTQLFYCALGALRLYQMPASVAQDRLGNLDNSIRDLGAKVSQTDGMLMGNKSLYFGALSMNAVYRWEYARDMITQGTTLDKVNMTIQTRLVQENTRMIWPDTFAMDDKGYLWVTPNRLPLFRNRELDFNNTSSNFYVAKIYVDDVSYLVEAEVDTSSGEICKQGVPLFLASLLIFLFLR